MTKKPAKKPKRQAKAAPQWYVKEWLKFLGLPQTHLINATGMSKGRISELLSGTERFNADTLEAFAKALNKRPYQLLLPPDAKQARILDLAEGVPEHQGAVVEEFLNALAKKG